MTDTERLSFRQWFSSRFDRVQVSGPILLLIVASLVVFASGPWANIPVLAGFLLVLVVSVLRHEGFGRLGFRRPQSWRRVFGLAILLAFVFEIGSSVFIEPFVETLTGDKSDFSAFEALKGNLVNTAVMLAVGWIVGGFLEEMFFRGYLVQEVGRLLGGKTIGYILGVIVSSIVFGLSHFYQGPTGMIMTGLMGLFFGILYLFNGRNIWLNILVHGFVDTIGFTLIYFGKYEALRELLPI